MIALEEKHLRKKALLVGELSGCQISDHVHGGQGLRHLAPSSNAQGPFLKKISEQRIRSFAFGNMLSSDLETSEN